MTPLALGLLSLGCFVASIVALVKLGIRARPELRYNTPAFRAAMRTARQAVSAPHSPPLTRSEVFLAYRMARDTGCIFLRNTVLESDEPLGIRFGRAEPGIVARATGRME